ncbi:MAG: helix-turn-helix domain-containing protein, partial [Atopobiaceae bacterium]|nr:helix-turn-helix domain-containing protein [Atopobiaceae bacterium]
MESLPPRWEVVSTGEKGRFNHLDASQRRSIEAGLSSGESLSQIARHMGVATSTVSREVKR